jgi:hypothetical protein
MKHNNNTYISFPIILSAGPPPNWDKKEVRRERENRIFGKDNLAPTSCHWFYLNLPLTKRGKTINVFFGTTWLLGGRGGGYFIIYLYTSY